VLAALMVLSLTSCGKKGIEGTWKYESGQAKEFSDLGGAYALTFSKGAVTVDVDWSKAGLSETDAAFAKTMVGMAKFTYELTSDTEMKVTISAESIGYNDTQTFTYKLNGDTLLLDGATFKRQ